MTRSLPPNNQRSHSGNQRKDDGLHQQPVKQRHPLRVALVDDDESLHHGLCRHLTGPDVGWYLDAYLNAASALQDIPVSVPQVVLMGISLPGMSGVDCTRKLKARQPGLPVVMLTARANAGTLLNAMMAGACGCLIKPLPPADLVPHLKKAVAGGMTFCPRAERLLLEELHGLQRSTSAFGLSRRENELMLCLCHHGSNKDLAAALGISEATVHVHLRNIFKKLAVHDRESAIRRFLENSPWSLETRRPAKAGIPYF